MEARAGPEMESPTDRADLAKLRVAQTCSTIDTAEAPSPQKDADDEVEETDGKVAAARKGAWRCRCSWLSELHASFGSFVPFAIITYGINQSVAANVGTFALRFYMRDVLQLDGATMGRLGTAAGLPWNMKPFMGMLSDGIALCGYHRRSYVVAAAACGLASYFLLGVMALPALALVVVMMTINLSISTTDVMVDGKAAELCREEPTKASDLHSLFWGVNAIFGLVSSGLKGSLVEWFSPQPVLLSLTTCSAAVLVPALAGWLKEDRLPSARCCNATLTEFRKHPAVSAVAVLMTVTSCLLSFVQVIVPNSKVRAMVTVVCAAAIALQSFRSLSKITPFLGRTALFVFLRQCLQPGLGETMFVWMTMHPEGPLLSPTKLGFVDSFGCVGLLVGVVVYNKFMTNWSYRKIFLVAQLTMFASQLAEIVLVMRWNVAIGIPDFLFLVGDDTFNLLVSRFFYIPMCVLAAKVCPANLEATLFATLMSLSNFGGAVSGFLGVSICELWGLVEGNFDNLPPAVLMKACTALLPIPLIFALVPTFTPNDPIPNEMTEDKAPRNETVEATESQAEVPGSHGLRV